MGEEGESAACEDTFKTPVVLSGPAIDRTPPETFTGSAQLRWRIDMARTEPYWEGWFKGLSNRFLGVPAAKMLLLAGVDRLDRELTVGQMQGLPQVGHTVHEDSPDRVAEVLATFLVRNKLASATEAFQPVGVVDRIPLGGLPVAPPTNNPTAGIGIKPA